MEEVGYELHVKFPRNFSKLQETVVTSELVMNTLSEKKKIRQTDLNQVAWF